MKDFMLLPYKKFSIFSIDLCEKELSEWVSRIFFFVTYLDQICHCSRHSLYWAAKIRHFMASFTLLMDDDESRHLKQMQIQFQLMYAEICSMLQFDEFFNYFLQNS